MSIIIFTWVVVVSSQITGVVVKGLKRMQFNIELRRIDSISQLKNVPTGVFPLLWVEEVRIGYVSITQSEDTQRCWKIVYFIC